MKAIPPSGRSFSLSTYLALAAKKGDAAGLPAMPPRQTGTVIWVRCPDTECARALPSLARSLQADGDDITLVVSLPAGIAPPTPSHLIYVTEPDGRGQTRAFLTHWAPDVMIWQRSNLDPIALVEIKRAGVPCVLIEANKDVLRPTGGGWVPGMTRGLIMQFTAILTRDKLSEAVMIRLGGDPDRIAVLGLLEDLPTPLPHSEEERSYLAQRLATRPLWLAAETGLTECDTLIAAHKQASARAHRLLLIVAVRVPDEGPAIAEVFRAAGFDVALRSKDEDPDDTTQIFVADMPGEMGLWYRLAPVTYLGGSFGPTAPRDPFEAATLGSAVLHGPVTAPFSHNAAKLAEANASVQLGLPSELGDAVETLLAADKTADIVSAAWDVTSRGAGATEHLTQVLRDILDAAGT